MAETGRKWHARRRRQEIGTKSEVKDRQSAQSQSPDSMMNNRGGNCLRAIAGSSRPHPNPQPEGAGAIPKARNSEILKLILKLLYKCSLMRDGVAVNLFATAVSEDLTAQKSPIGYKLLSTETKSPCGHTHRNRAHQPHYRSFILHPHLSSSRRGPRSLQSPTRRDIEAG